MNRDDFDAICSSSFDELCVMLKNKLHNNYLLIDCLKNKVVINSHLLPKLLITLNECSSSSFIPRIIDDMMAFSPGIIYTKQVLSEEKIKSIIGKTFIDLNYFKFKTAKLLMNAGCGINMSYNDITYYIIDKADSELTEMLLKHIHKTYSKDKSSDKSASQFRFNFKTVCVKSDCVKSAINLKKQIDFKTAYNGRYLPLWNNRYNPQFIIDLINIHHKHRFRSTKYYKIYESELKMLAISFYHRSMIDTQKILYISFYPYELSRLISEYSM